MHLMFCYYKLTWLPLIAIARKNWETANGEGSPIEVYLWISGLLDAKT